MKDRLTQDQAQAILKALDDAIEKGPWDESNFLRAIGRNLREIRQNFANQIGSGQDQQTQIKKESGFFASQGSQRTEQQEVFIALYSTEGNNIQAWERLLANLPRQMISRPIYADEQDVKNLIKAKANKVNEAYVAAYINQSDILSIAADKIPTDRFGKPLLSLKDRSLSLDNITRFVHLSGVYHYVKGRLVKKSPSE
ncbi:IcmQ protein [Legionella lansingensis]|uniref:IcmQ n=1 Tax=Legionella lansingensis TaxID=45067 RepID=Q49J81_9GAMM|nr:Dot/Icm secretion system protein IcmQ [Legionella lansingensis]AAX56195.1 IcmQ [Legionella lansingensis]KTD19366.1 IcmQ protein [Legionella lansingensis]SNV53418.1 IcmQ protein [Legionella lansingensis]